MAAERLRAVRLVFVVLLFLGVAYALGRRPQVITLPSGAFVLEGAHVRFVLDAKTSDLAMTLSDAGADLHARLVLVREGVHHPLSLTNLTADEGSLVASLTIDVGDGAVPATLDAHVDAANDAIVIHIRGAPPNVALGVELTTERAFLSGKGDLADIGEETGRWIIADAGGASIGVASNVDCTAKPSDHSLVISAPDELRLAVADGDRRAFAALAALDGIPLRHVSGRVNGASGTVRVIGLDSDSRPQLRAMTDPSGRFELDAMETVTLWFATVDEARSSAPVSFRPGSPGELILDVSDGGEIRVRVTDADTKLPITARLLVHGVDGTLDPSFGPDYKASGAGPVIDALRGEVTTPVPAGRYRVAATKGIEWSIDARTITVSPGDTVDVQLAPRHVVSTPNVYGCDLHVHARPSFDTPVATEDRVLSLVAAGVDFAVPTEHNIVGDYEPSLDVLELSNELATVSGVEVTTFTPRFGHFGVFPYPKDKPVPPYKMTNPDAVFFNMRGGDPNRYIQVNHPRLEKTIGYFDVYGYKPGQPPPPAMRWDFDGIEVYNGYDMATPARVDAVMTDWFALLNAGKRYVGTASSDSHRIQYQWAGYPRTMARVGHEAAKPLEIVDAIRHGRSFMTSGPFIDVELREGPRSARPGDELVTNATTLTVHVVVRAAPWVDVSSVELVVNGTKSVVLSVPRRDMVLGTEDGTLAEASKRTVRLDGETRIDTKSPAWIVAIARGTRTLDEVLPFMPVVPLAITNPIWVRAM